MKVTWVGCEFWTAKTATSDERTSAAINDSLMFPILLASDNTGQRAARGSQRVDPALHLRIVHQQRSMEGFDAGIDHQRPAAAPVSAAGFSIDAVDVRGRIGAGEGRPQEVVQVGGHKTAVVADHDQRKSCKARPLPVEAAETLDNRIALPPSLTRPRPLDRQNARQADIGTAETGRELQAGRRLVRQPGADRTRGGDDDLGTLVETAAAVIEGVDGGGGLEMQSAAPVDPLQQMAEESGDIVGMEA